MKALIKVIFLCYSVAAFSQSKSSSSLLTNTDWVNKNLDYIKFYKDSVRYNLGGKKHTLFYELKNKALTFKEKYSVGGTDNREEKINFRIKSLSEDRLIIYPLDEQLDLDQEVHYKLDYAPFFNRKEFVFYDRENQVDYVDYKKITFHGSTCFGTCPSFSLEINRGGQVFYQGRIYTKEFTGDFEGVLEKDERIALHKLLNRSLLFAINDNWKQLSRVTDNPRYNYIIELRNGDTVEINTNDQHPILDKLSEYFVSITEKLELTKAKEKHSYVKPSVYGFQIVVRDDE
ncbi:MAG: DUF6438 domain-containing protein [Flavobacteriaceae bacterium]|nr:DUF6438 domain-containing protein [Flavobacteriaceae bacterium]